MIPIRFAITTTENPTPCNLILVLSFFLFFQIIFPLISPLNAEVPKPLFVLFLVNSKSVRFVHYDSYKVFWYLWIITYTAREKYSVDFFPDRFKLHYSQNKKRKSGQHAVIRIPVQSTWVAHVHN